MTQSAIDFGTFISLLAQSRGNAHEALGRAEGNLDPTKTPRPGFTPAPKTVIAALRAMVFGNSGTSLGAMLQKALGSGMILKTTVAPALPSDATWAGPLIQLAPLGAEFVALMRPLTVLGRLNYRPVPFNCVFSRTTSGVSAGWATPNKPNPLGRMSLESVSLGFARIVGTAIITQELAHNSSPDAASMISADIAESLRAFMDTAFLDPDLAPVADTNPASITYGAQQFGSSGGSFANVVADLKLMMKYMTDNSIRLAECTWVMSEATAANWATLTNTNSDFAFEDLSPAGGTLFGLPVITSGSLPLTFSPTETFVVLVHGPSIAVADSGTVDAGVTTEAAAQMDDAPATGPQALVSLWHNNLIGIKLSRYCNWTRRRDKAVCVLRGIQ